MVKINIRDKNFGGEPSSCHNGKNKFVEWEFGNIKVSKSCFITDMCLPDVFKSKNINRKIAWVLEPRAIHPHVYDWIEKNNKHFDFVLTFDKYLVEKGENYLYYPYGSCWINNYIEKEKDKKISIIASSKKFTKGHMLRHEIIEKFKNDIDVFGGGYFPIENKEEGLSSYKFSITVENSIQRGYWSEKIVDCFATKTIPIYWGDNTVCDYFNSEGMIFFKDLSDLEKIIKEIKENGDSIYLSKQNAIIENFKNVDKFRIAEDWIFEKYNFLFN